MTKGKLAFLFPGQGSQYVGMGKDLWENFSLARQTYQEADETVNFRLSALCFSGPGEVQTLTANAQPAILATSIAAHRVLISETGIEPDLVAGHSLGEYSALVAAGALRFGDALRTVRERGRLMQEACPEGLGKMVAVLGLEAEELSSLCRKVAPLGVIQVANYNAPGQQVVSGHGPAVEALAQLALAQGAKKAIPLAVSGPFHSPLMEPAAAGLARFLEGVEIFEPRVPVLANVTADLSYDGQETGDKARKLLVAQVCSPVLWEQSMKKLVAMGVSRVAELGPGRVLSALVKRVNKDLELLNLETSQGLAAFRAWHQ